MKTLTLTTAALALTASLAFAQGNPGAHFVENWDLNGDGQVTLEEATERRGNVFASFDANEDGFLDAEEYTYFDQARENDMKENAQAHGMGQGNGQGKGQGMQAMKNAAGGMALEVNDTDGDGKVSHDEFITNTAAWITGMDRNGDAVITTADFGPKN